MIIMPVYFAVCFAKIVKVILAAFKFYNVEQRHLGAISLPFTVNQLKLDSEIRNMESYSSFPQNL